MLSRKARPRVLDAKILRDAAVRRHDDVHLRQQLVVARARRRRGVQRLGRADLAVGERVAVAALAGAQRALRRQGGVDVLGCDGGVGREVCFWVWERRVADYIFFPC